ncbi:MAG: YqiA/YcfP family alpha/beta fold hydrolase [Nitrospinaceae bacterium]
MAPRRGIQFIYLHGFSSSPGSNKARVFRERFAERGLPLWVPDLEGNDFQNLTITRQMDIIRRTLEKHRGDGFGLIGSSMGGFLAALAAQIHTEVAAIYLMCPGFEFVKRWKTRLLKECGEGNAIPDLIPVFNYRYNKTMELNSRIFEDAAPWEALPLDRRVPTRVVHGVKDETVDISHSRDFAESRPWASITELDADHGLLSHIEWIVADCLAFFQTHHLLDSG